MKRVEKIKEIINEWFYSKNREQLNDVYLKDLALQIDEKLVKNNCDLPDVSQQSEQLVAFAMWLRKSDSVGDAEILVNAFKEAANCG